MRVRICSPRKILQPCELRGYNFQIDPYIGCEHHCYYCYALNQAETDWSQEILVHQDFAGQLVHELSALAPQPIYFGWYSDPYQPAETTHKQTRQALETLTAKGFSVCMLTKSGLVTRDIDLLERMPGSSVGFSIAFHDDSIRMLFEANAPPNNHRVAALKTLKEAGIETYVLICPVLPFITDLEACIKMVAPYADTLWFYGLSISSEQERNWQYLCQILDRYYPDLAEKYHQMASSSDHPYWGDLRNNLKEIQASSGLDMRINL